MSESKLKMADGKGGWIEMEIRPPECPAWEDGRHCFVARFTSGGEHHFHHVVTSGGDATTKRCACGAEVRRK